ncbi:glycosyltransferase 25 family member [Ctenocephalides felis]|uniref:glycosyltransferase 25 family member n=1 Tax=Ctenocephalides felis TaxID=7515 RepID=UPI000E6E1AB7|nr:glycosyltransferase 25 family member [Ctenocephalides felis]
MKLLILFLISCTFQLALSDNNPGDQKLPSVLIVTLIRNKGHTLPYFFSLLESLNYPKDRISLWIRSDNNIDHSLEITKLFLDKISEQYHSVDYEYTTKKLFSSNEDNNVISKWSEERFKHVIKLKEEALGKARKMWADYVFFLDADVFLTNPDTLLNLIAENEIVISPMLKSDGMYSNFWCGMTADYYYKRTEEYKPILYRENLGKHQVPMIHSAVLINLNRVLSDKLTFNPDNLKKYSGPVDDIITFAYAANVSGIPLIVSNKEPFGYVMVPLEQGDSLQHDYIQLTNLKLLVLGEMKPLYVNEYLQHYIAYPQTDKMGFDEIYMINLLRRPERRERMRLCFQELGINAKTVNAVDGRSLNDSCLVELGISFMPEFIDPYHKRPMTMGEIGCFLSHYNIWKEASSMDYNLIMILEDDVRFEPFFRQKLQAILREIQQNNVEYDLLYIGRKRLLENEEPYIENSRLLVKPSYSYWTLGYILTKSGIQKLLKAEPLKNMVPVDEYLPILFDKHPRDAWKTHFPDRDLIALSTAPLLVYPTHYTGEPGYFSDTEDSNIIPDNLILNNNINEDNQNKFISDPGVKDDL